MRKATNIYSIYGQIERVVADNMIKEGKFGAKIPQQQIPQTQLINDKGQIAMFAVPIPAEHMEEFRRRCVALYA